MALNEKLVLLESELQTALAQSERVATLKAEINALKKPIPDEQTGENQYGREDDAAAQIQVEKKATPDAAATPIGDNTIQADADRVNAEVCGVNNDTKELPDLLTFATSDADKSGSALIDERSLKIHVPHGRVESHRGFASGPLSIFLAVSVGVAIGYLWCRAK